MSSETILTPNEEAVYGPRRRRGTRQENERATEIGLFGPEERLELIEGEVIRKVPQNTPHATALLLATDLLRQAFGVGLHVRAQLPLAIGPRSEPEPDLAVVSGSPRDYEDAHPISARLVVEISDTTLRFDRTTKAGLYARAGVVEYWIVNLNERILEVHREPVSMPGRTLRHGYRVVTTLSELETVVPLEAPSISIRVSDLLPRRRS